MTVVWSAAGPVRLGTRGSALARIQAEIVADALRSVGARVQIEILVTDGDRRAADTAWGEGAFVTAIEEALLDGR
ncbi:MAG: hydroxymethylbilane synthase, partial [Chloroflexi bacterium]|nr:hydroxymethylbilane synthase [Chloroflexota bacterium]